MKVGILYICTGRYRIFWDDFFTSCERNFLPGFPKEYFVFTDSVELPHKHTRNVNVHYQEKLGWPFDTLDRFKIFSRIREDLEKCDYLFFMNANSLIVDKVGEEILDHEYSLIGAKHPVYYDKDRSKFPYERLPHSSACMGPDEGYHYFVGGFNGGKSSDYLQMIIELTERIEHEKQKGVIALWHDESHLNRYYFENHDKVKVLSPSYIYPEGKKLPFKKVNLLRDKKNLGGHDYLRGKSDKRKSSFLLKISKIYKSFQ